MFFFIEEESLAKPEALNSGAISVINRVSSKLTGKDFRDMKPGRNKRTIGGFDDFSKISRSNFNTTETDASTRNSILPAEAETTKKEFKATISQIEWSLSAKNQVDRLIEEATRVQNLCQSYVGWCPFW